MHPEYTHKKCPTCGVVKQVSDFGHRPERRDGLDSQCRACKSVARRRWRASDQGRDWIERNRTRLNADAVVKTKQRRDDIRTYLTSYKRANGCALCPENEPVCLDFHHVNPATKVITISRIQNEKKSWSSLQKELPKCVLLCANCHRKFHAGLARELVGEFAKLNFPDEVAA